MTTSQQAAQYAAQLIEARGHLSGVQACDRSFLRASRITALQDHIQTLEMLVDLCQREDAQLVEDLAAA